MGEIDTNTALHGTRNIAILVVLAAAYYLGAWLCTAMVADTGAGWVQHLATAWGLKRTTQPVLLSLLGFVGLFIISVPVGGIIARLYPRRAAALALLVALPATLSLLVNVLVIWGSGFHLAGAVRWLITFDTAKTLLLPSLLIFIVPRLMPRRTGS